MRAPTRRLVVVIILSAASAAAVACGLDAVGAAGTGAAPDDGAAPDGWTPLPGDASPGDGSPGDGGGGGDGAADADAAPVDAGIDADAGRVTGAVALYTFEEGTGAVAHDVSGVTPALDLTITGDGGAWIDGGGFAITSPTLLSSAAAAKIVAACKASDAVTLEVWLRPANTTQGSPTLARIAGLTLDTSTLDISLTAQADRYLHRIRTSTSGEGANDVFTDGGVKATLTHVVATRDATGLRRGYVDGQMLFELTTGGDLSTWSDYAIAVADEHSRTRPWLGELHLVAFYARALTPSEVQQNLAAGP